jgi:imidazolonepropionase-like amidohydrolase
MGLVAAACGSAPREVSPPVVSATLALVGGAVVTGPGAPRIEDAAVLIDGDRIVAVGPRATTPVPAGAKVIACEGATVLAGFWNSHVHFLEDAFAGAADKPAAQLAAALDEMLLRWGFVHVVDTGSGPANTAALRKRIEAGEIAGPSIVIMGGMFVAVGGQPRYVPFPLPQLADPESARRAAAAVLDAGADGIKLVTVSVVAKPPAPVMPVAVVQAVVETAHARGAWVVVHPTTITGVRVAVDGGVDMLAHTSPETGPWSAEDIARIRRAGVALTPTLKLWKDDVSPSSQAAFEAAAAQQVRELHAAGGALLFGTDVGYLRDHDPSLEYERLASAGLDFSAILAMLTTAPAARWTRGKTTGRLVAGEPGDVVVLDGDPARDVAAWTRVRHAVRGGVLVHTR